MGIISEMFNFDNVGQKIKNFAKWSCWIEILVLWIVSLIEFVILITDEFTAAFFWVPIVVAIVGPIIIWVGSWCLYAFGESVEHIAEMNKREKEEFEKRNKAQREKEYIAPASGAFFQNLKNGNTEKIDSVHKWRCDKCGNLISNEPCPYCLSNAESVRIVKDGSGEITCPVCNTVQRDDRTRCFHCTVSFITE